MFWDKVKVILRALPAQLAAVQSILTVLAVEVVPLLPENVAVRAGAWLVVAAGWVAAAVSVVSRVTPVPVNSRGLLVPFDRQLVVKDTALGDEDAVGQTIITANLR